MKIHGNTDPPLSLSFSFSLPLVSYFLEKRSWECKREFFDQKEDPEILMNSHILCLMEIQWFSEFREYPKR